ncbi:hypothetical protein EPUL_005869, partial [Erysiphe pulchra]
MSSPYNVLKNPVETLSKSNWRKVFTDLRLWLESKGLFYACLHEKEKYYSITYFRDRIPTDIEILIASVAALHAKKDDEAQKSSANKSNVMKHERSIQWEKDESAESLAKLSFQKQHRRDLSGSPEERYLDRERKQPSRNRARGYRCYMCKSEEQRVDTCQYKERAYEWALQLCLKEEKVSTRSSKSFKHPSTRKDPDRVANSRRTQLNRPKVKTTAYVAQDIDSGSENEAVEEERIMAYSDETTCGKPRNSPILPTLHADTAASSHVTDDLMNFRGPLRPTCRVIKVCGGKLICTEMGDAIIMTENGNAILKDCLLVPGLGANLMSVRKACIHAGLKGVFDARAMYLVKDKKVVLIAFHVNGIYTVSSLSPTIKSEIALQSQNLKNCFE